MLICFSFLSFCFVSPTKNNNCSLHSFCMERVVFHKLGAEAELSATDFDGTKALAKTRLEKNYRSPALDKKIRSSRTRSEAKLLRAVCPVVNVPQVLEVNESASKIVMEFIKGKALKEIIQKRPELCKEAGMRIRLIHELGVIHGDLTTSNILVAKKDAITAERIKKNGELFFVDFGLGFFSKKLEDRATDLVVFKKTFNATHSSLKNGWALVLEGYNPSKELLTRMQAIEKRARYH